MLESNIEFDFSHSNVKRKKFTRKPLLHVT